MSTSAELVPAGKIRSGTGSVVYHFPVLDSTNAFAAKLLQKSSPPHGTIISADYQTAGKGQPGKSWHSSPGKNLLMSVILYPDLQAQDQFLVSMAVALAVRDVVAGSIEQSAESIGQLARIRGTRRREGEEEAEDKRQEAESIEHRAEGIEEAKSKKRQPARIRQQEACPNPSRPEAGPQSTVHSPQSTVRTDQRMANSEQRTAISVKWPNDIYIGDQKVAGILIQNTLQGDKIKSCIAGIGLNVNETDFPPDIPNPTTLLLTLTRAVPSEPLTSERPAKQDLRVYLPTGTASQTRDPLPLAPIFDHLCHSLDHRFAQLTANPASLRNDYLDALYRLGIPSMFRIVADGIDREGVISHVEASGRLVVLWEDGVQEAYQNGELVFL